jgi:hypothetical protein
LTSDITIDNFINPEAFRKDRLTDSDGGILIYIRNTLLGRRRLDLEVPEVESVCLEIFADNIIFLLVCLYRPPNARVSSCITNINKYTTITVSQPIFTESLWIYKIINGNIRGTYSIV